MRAPFISSPNAPLATGDRFYPVQTFYSSSHGASATETNAAHAFPIAGVLRTLYLKTVTAPGSGKSIVFTIMKNAAATGLTCTLSDTSAAANDTTNSVTVAPGDRISLRATPSGTPTVAQCRMGLGFESTTIEAQVILAGNPNVFASTSADTYYPFQEGPASATNTNFGAIVPTDGTISRLYLQLGGVAGTAKSYTVTLIKNGSATALTVTVSGNTDVLGSDTANLVSVVAGDLVYWKVTPSGTPNGTATLISAAFTPAKPGESIHTYSSNSVSAISNGMISQGGGDLGSWNTTDANRLGQSAFAGWMRKIYASVVTAPGTSKSIAFTARIVTADSANLKATISGAGTTGNDTTNAELVEANEMLGIRAVGTGTPTYSATSFSFVFDANTPATVAATTTIASPTVTTGGSGATVTPSVVAAVTTIAAPTASGGATASPALVSAVSTIAAPTLATGSNAAPAIVSATTTIAAPTVATGSTVVPALVNAVTTIAAAVVATGSTVIAAIVSATTTIADAVVGSGATVLAALVVATTTIGTPAVASASTVSPAVVSAVTTISAPTVSVSVGISPAVVAAVTTFFSPAPPSFVATTSGSVSGTSLVISTPPGTAQGDVMIAAVNARAGGVTAVSSPDWNVATFKDRVGAGRLVLLTRVASASEPSTHTFTITGGSTNLQIGAISTFRLANAQVTQVNSANGGITGGVLTTASLSATGPSQVLRFVAIAAATSTPITATWPTSTEFADSTVTASGITSAITGAYAPKQTGTSTEPTENVSLTAPDAASWASLTVNLPAAPLVATGAGATPALVAATTTIAAPTVATGVNLNAAIVSATTTIAAPSVATGSRVSPALITAITTIGAASLTTGISASVITAVTTIAAPSVSVGSALAPALVAATTTIASPTVAVGQTVSTAIVVAIAVVASGGVGATVSDVGSWGPIPI